MANNRLDQITSNIAPPSTAGSANTNGLADLVKALSPSGGQNLPDAVSQASQQLTELKGVNQTNAELLAANTQAITQNTAGQSGAKGVAGAVGNFASSFLGNALSFLPLVSGLMNLFGGGSAQPTPLVSYSAPQPLNVNEAGGSGAAVYDQSGLPRTATTSPQNLIGLSAPASSPVGTGASGNGALQSGAGDAGPAGSSAQTPTNITVQVNAMDSRSFLDHSNEIAQAVRDAMLNMHSLNDVVNDL